MAMTTCPSCGARMSNLWPSCPACGYSNKENTAKKRFNGTVHYLLATLLTTIGAVLTGAWIMGLEFAPGSGAWGMSMVVIGAVWYGGARIFAMFR